MQNAMRKFTLSLSRFSPSPSRAIAKVGIMELVIARMMRIKAAFYYILISARAMARFLIKFSHKFLVALGKLLCFVYTYYHVWAHRGGSITRDRTMDSAPPH